jgi:hypothetical protein
LSTWAVIRIRGPTTSAERGDKMNPQQGTRFVHTTILRLPQGKRSTRGGADRLFEVPEGLPHRTQWQRRGSARVRFIALRHNFVSKLNISYLFLIFYPHENLGVGDRRSTSSSSDARKLGRSTWLDFLELNPEAPDAQDKPVQPLDNE